MYELFTSTRTTKHLTRRGDPIYDDITNGDLLAQLIGFPPTEYTRAAEETSAAKRLDVAAQAAGARYSSVTICYVSVMIARSTGA